ncbi:hypothetical protein [Ilumatobacter coccineus]|nr:hypothetical protein [Ilumatobacter coccineus]
MVTTLMHTPTRKRFVPRAPKMSFSMSSKPSVVSPAASHVAFPASAAAASTTTTAPTNRWLGGFDGLGCGDAHAYGTKRILPGRLGGMT